MSVTYGFFNAQQVNGDYDRKYGADELAEYFASLIGNGISADIADCFKITPVSGMQISINAGYAWINGYWVKNDSAVIKTLAVAPSANSRKDSIVLRFSKADRSIELFVVQGDASSTPSFKPLTRTSDVYELMIGYITIAAGVSAITSAMITDTRENTDYCGIISTFSQRVLPDGSITSIKLANDSVVTAKIKNKNVTSSKLSDECKNIIRENVVLSVSAFVENSSIDGANYKAEIPITGCTAAMLPIIAWTISQSDELEVQQVESALGKIVIYTANAPSNDITIPTVALISPIGTGSSGTGTRGSGTPGANGVTFTPHLSTDGVLSWANDGGLANPDPVNIKGAPGAKGDKGDKGDPGSDASVTAANIKSALGYTPLKESDIVTETTEVLPSYTNQIAAAGYEASAQLDMTGAVASGTSFVSGFIPVKKGDIIRVKDPSASEFSTGLVFALYKADKAAGNNIGRYVNTMQSNTIYGTVTISGNVLTWDTSTVGYYFWSDFAYVRVMTNSADSILTVNEEIVETTQTVKTLKSGIKVSKSSLNFETSPAMLADRKIVVFGDSLIGMTRDQTSVTAYAAAYTGATVYNVGFGGCRMSTHPTAGYAAFSMWALAAAIATNTWTAQDAQASSGADYFPEQLALLKSIDFSTVDEIVIHYGTNDFAANVQIDDSSNTTSTSTVCGALRYSIQKILGAYPKIKIFVSLPIYRMWNNEGAETYINSLKKKLPEYNAAMQAVAESYNLPVIDGYGNLGINSLNDSTYSSDGTHLNDLGRRIFGQLIGGYLISGKGSSLQSINGSTGAIKTTATFDAIATDNSFTPQFSAGDATIASEQGYMCVLNVQGEFPVLPDGGNTIMSFYLMPIILNTQVELWGGSFVNPFTGDIIVMTYGFNNGSTVALYKKITASS